MSLQALIYSWNSRWTQSRVIVIAKEMLTFLFISSTWAMVTYQCNTGTRSLHPQDVAFHVTIMLSDLYLLEGRIVPVATTKMIYSSPSAMVAYQSMRIY